MRDPQWAIALLRKGAIPEAIAEAALLEALATPARPGALAIIAGTASPTAATASTAAVSTASPNPAASTFARFAQALADGEIAAIDAIAGLDADGAARLAARAAELSPVARAIAARALAGAPAGVPLVAALLVDADPEVAYAALRTALALASGGASLPAQPIARALEVAQAALVAHLDARDASAAWSACARHELEVAIRRCVARVLRAAAVEAAASGRDPAPLTATARHLIGGRDADRKRALDVVQELQAGRAEILAVLERWLRAPDTAAPDTAAAAIAALAAHDPWLAQLAAGELAALEPTLALLRMPALLATVAGPALADLAARAPHARRGHDLPRGRCRRHHARRRARRPHRAPRANTPDRRIEVGGVVGELAVLTHAPRAATVLAAEPDTEVLVIDRATFASATSPRAPSSCSACRRRSRAGSRLTAPISSSWPAARAGETRARARSPRPRITRSSRRAPLQAAACSRSQARGITTPARAHADDDRAWSRSCTERSP